MCSYFIQATQSGKDKMMFVNFIIQGVETTCGDGESSRENLQYL